MKPWAKAAVQGAACGVMFGLVVLIGGRLWHPATVAAQAKEPAVAEVVRARRFEMVDAAGKARAVLSVLPDGRTGLLLVDAGGKGRVILRLHSDGTPVLALYDAAGKERASLSLLPDGSPALGFHDAAGKTRAALSVRPDGTSTLVLADAAGKVIWKAP